MKNLNYPVEITKKEDNTYLATIPFLETLKLVGEGSTVQEAYDNLILNKEKLFSKIISENINIVELPTQERLEEENAKLKEEIDRLKRENDRLFDLYIGCV